MNPLQSGHMVLVDVSKHGKCPRLTGRRHHPDLRRQMQALQRLRAARTDHRKDRNRSLTRQLPQPVHCHRNAPSRQP